MIEETPRILDISLLEGTTTPIEGNYKFNILRTILHKNTDSCWECHRLNRCSIERIFRCEKVKHITEHLNKEDYLL